MHEDKATFRDLLVLYRNAHLSKSRHFAAAMRCKKLNNGLSSFVVFINIGLGSVFFALISMELPDVAKWASAFLALIAALCSGALNSFNYSRQFEGHRNIANRYLAFGRQCELLLSRYFDGLMSLEDVSEDLPNFHKTYHEINVDAEILPTRNADYRKARKQEDHRRNQMLYRTEFLDQEMAIAHQTDLDDKQ